jgi:hypothetical protein
MLYSVQTDRLTRGLIVLVALVGGSLASVASAQASSPPRVGTVGVEVTGATTAVVGGFADAEGQSTMIHADYALAGEPWCVSEGKEGMPSETAPEDLGSAYGIEDEISVRLEGLLPASEYCVELVVTNASGTAHGRQRRFTTDSAQSSSLGGQVKQESKLDPLVLLVTPPIVTSPPGLTTTVPRPLTRARKLANALKTCESKPKRRRARCDRRVRMRYDTAAKATKKTGKQANSGKR